MTTGRMLLGCLTALALSTATALANSTVLFDANGGEGAMEPFHLLSGAEQTLPLCTFLNANGFFLGWALSADGEAALLDGDSTVDIEVAPGETITLYAVWHEGWTWDYCHKAMASFYVDVTNGSDLADGRSWATARRTIQSAINSATDGETILVADGVYEPIVCTDKTLTIYSVHGAISTTIDANGAARRCANLGNGVSLVGFTLQNGRFSVTSWDGGGGARGGILWNCIIRNNSGRDGGGVQDSECHNCLFYGNNALNGGGGCGTMYNCTIVGNIAENNGGGITGGSYYNCIITDNKKLSSSTYYGNTHNTAEGIWSSEFHSCLIGEDASFVNAANHDYRLTATSPCIGTGSNEFVTDGDVDLHGNVRIANGTVDIGCYEYGSYGSDVYAICFNANGGERTMPKRVYASGDDVTLPTMAFTRDGYIFVGWATEPDGPIVYADGETINGGLHAGYHDVVTLYAQWGFPIGNGIWKYPSGDGPITLGAPLVAPSGEVVIPNEIDGRPVVGITADAFAGNTAITAITIPASVTNLPTVSVSSIAAGNWYLLSQENGVAEYRSAYIGNNGVTSMSMSLSLGEPFEMSFDWKVSSEDGCDYLRWSLDGVEQSCISGDVDWHTVTCRVPRGEHTIEWMYSKDGSECAGADCGWIRCESSLVRVNAFWGCTNIRHVTFGQLFGYQLLSLFPDAGASVLDVEFLDGVESIPVGFFRGCTNLTAVTIPNSVTNIGASAFAGCGKLMSVTIPDSVTNVGNNAFSGCSSLKSVSLGNGVTSLNGFDFRGSESLEEIAIGSGVKTIEEKAFLGCSALKRVLLANGIQNIRGGAFANCPSLTFVKIPETVEALEAEIKWHTQWHAFDNAHYNADTDLYEGWIREEGPFENSGLITIELGNNIKKLGYGAFKNCSQLMAVSIPDSVEGLGEYVFCGCVNLKEITVGKGLKEIGGGAFMGCQKLSRIGIPGTVERVKSIGVCYISDYYCKDGAFENSGLTTVEIGNGVGEIGARVFKNCANLQTVKVLGHIGSIGENAFEGCDKLASVQVSDLAAWSEIQFDGAPANPLFITHKLVVNGKEITNLVIPSGARYVGSYAFTGCNRMTSVTISEGATSIGEGAFSGCSGLTSVSIPSSVTGIGGGAFRDCDIITTVTIPGHFRMYDIFPHPEKFMNLRIPLGTTSIVADAFRNCYNLRAIVIPDSVKSVGANAFEDCKGLVALKIGKGVESIANGSADPYNNACHAVFARCYTLTAFEVDAANKYFKTVNGVLFTKDGKELVAFPAGCSGEYAVPYDTEKIWAGAFCGAFDLVNLLIPDTVMEIGAGAFRESESLYDVYLPARFKGNKNTYFAVRNSSSCSYCTFTYGRPMDRTLKLDGQGGVVATTTVNPSYCYAMPAVSVPTRAGYTFAGYYSAPNGGGTQYYTAFGKSARTWDSTTVTTLYAKWVKSPTPITYKVAFNANGGKGKMAAQKMVYGKAAKLTKNVFVRKGYVFAGWAKSKADAKKGVIAFANAAAVKNLLAKAGTVTLYAVWAKPTYKVAFYANGGTGKTVVQTFKYGKAAKLAACKFKAPKGRKFVGWATSAANAKKGVVKFKNKQAVKNLIITGKTVKLYAVWKK